MLRSGEMSLGATLRYRDAMPGIKRSTKSRALINALVGLREETGLSGHAFAAKIGINQSTWNRYETGSRTPSDEVLDKVFDRLEVAEERRADIRATIHGTNDRQWLATALLERQAQFAALRRLDVRAKRVIHNAPDLIPGPLQNSDYIRAIMESHWAGLDPDEVELRITMRIGRRDLITRRNPAQYVAVLGESALRQLVGDVSVQISQLRYLLELAEQPNIELRAYRRNSGWHPGLDGPFIFIEPEDDSPIVHVAIGHSGLFLHAEDDVSYYQDVVTTLIGDPKAGEEKEIVAMSPKETVGLIADVIKELETT